MGALGRRGLLRSLGRGSEALGLLYSLGWGTGDDGGAETPAICLSLAFSRLSRSSSAAAPGAPPCTFFFALRFVLRRQSSRSESQTNSALEPAFVYTRWFRPFSQLHEPKPCPSAQCSLTQQRQSSIVGSGLRGFVQHAQMQRLGCTLCD